jgi:hypothetical protein
VGRCTVGAFSRESRPGPDRKDGGDLGRKRRVQSALRPFAFTNLTTRRHNSRRHASEVTDHASRATGLCTCCVRARPDADRATQHTCDVSTVHRYYTQHKDTLRRFCKPSAGGSDRRAHMHMKNDGARSALRRPSLSSLVSRAKGRLIDLLRRPLSPVASVLELSALSAVAESKSRQIIGSRRRTFPCGGVYSQG